MSILTAIPEELLAAAAQLAGVGSSLTAQNAGAAAPTTTIAPAAADQVSALQAALFSSYGTLYQQIAAEAETMQQQFLQNLGLSSGNYAAAEATNVAQSAPVDQFSTFVDGIATFLGGPTTSVGGNPFSPSGNSANVVSYEIGNWASAASNCLGMAGGGLVPSDAWPTAAGDAAAAGADAAGAAAAVDMVTPTSGLGAMSMMPMAGVGQATMVSSLTSAPSWASPLNALPGTTNAAVQTVGWTSPMATQTGAPVTALPGMPGAGAAAKGSAMGAPRYGVKPVVMPKPTAV
ncbi:MAG: PE family protein [Mycobacterium sp.]